MEKLFSNSPTPILAAWEKTGDETKLAGKFGLSLISQNFYEPGKQAVDEYVFCRKNPGVTVLPLLSNGNLVITRTFKQGSGAIVWEFPAGFMDKNNNTVSNLDQQARAELSEESGLRTKKMTYLGRAYVAPRKFDTFEQLYIALDCVMSESGPTPGKGEILEVYEMTPTEFWAEVLSLGGLVSGFSEIAAWRAAAFGYMPGPR